MGGVLSYSGLSTKIRAMQSRLTTMDQFEEILQLADVQQVAAYLKRMPEYSSKWNSKEIYFPEFLQALPFCQSGTAQIPGSVFQSL